MPGQQEKAAQFWAWFEAARGSIEALNLCLSEGRMPAPGAVALIEGIATAISAYDPRLAPYCGVAADGLHELVVSADGDSAAFAAVYALVRMAPRVPGWRIVPLRQREPISGIIEAAEVRLDVSRLRYHLDRRDDPPTLILLAEEDVSRAFEAYQVLGAIVAMTVLGEETVATRIGRVGVVTLSRFEDRWGHEGEPLQGLAAELPIRHLC